MGTVIGEEKKRKETFRDLDPIKNGNGNGKFWKSNFSSPWSNTYSPPLEDGAMPSESLRQLEIDANAAFDQYRDMYFEGGVSSVYLWDLDSGFAGEKAFTSLWF
jgi:F-actin capping protein, beta subunit.